MPVFSYKTMDHLGRESSGQLEAENGDAVVFKLRGQGLMVLDVKENRTSSFGGLLQTRRKVKLGELAIFSRQLVSMLGAGIPLTRSLFTLSRQTEHPTLAKALEDIARRVESGMSFSEALTAYPHIFSSQYVNMIQAGEVGGTLEEMISYLAKQLEKEKKLRDQVRTASTYPTVVICFAITVMLGMLTLIVPVFMKMLPEGIEIPLGTKIIFWASDSLRHWWFLYFIVVIAVVFGIVRYFKSSAGARAYDRVRFKLPVFGSLIHKVILARFCRTLSTLLAGGIPVLKALESTGAATGSSLMQEAVANTVDKIQEGKSISGPLDKSGLFPPIVVQMVAVGEESGNLPSLLEKVAEFYEDEVENIAKTLSSLIEPVMIIFIGVLVGSMLISMYMPIFTVITQSVR